ncbi:hypothetical protein TIFTF001_030597 [Ficus carica]|uniref:Uncharacterized protein n=1 Tax=Ficus carica TaxID=3494 RepID=A0AA88J561_FICCA|nr:hypothetical protein TIFTF001_030597 [Ficus carica]
MAPAQEQGQAPVSSVRCQVVEGVYTLSWYNCRALWADQVQSLRRIGWAGDGQVVGPSRLGRSFPPNMSEVVRRFSRTL